WTSTNAILASLDHSVGTTTTSGSYVTLPLTSPSTYTLTVSGAGGIATCSTQVGVSGTPPPLTTIIDTNLLALPVGGEYVQGPIVIDGKSGVTISGKNIFNKAGPCIVIKNSNDIHIAHN